MYTKKANHVANVILAIAMFALSLDVFHSAYLIFGYYNILPQFIGITFAFPFLYGPIFYIYAKLVSEEKNTFKSSYYFHFLPFLIIVLYGIIFVYFKNNEFKSSIIQNDLERTLPLMKFVSYLKPVNGIIYVVLTIKVVRVYNKIIQDSYSNIEKINLDWLRYLATRLSFVCAVVIVNYGINLISPAERKMDHLILLSAPGLIYPIGY